MQKRPFFFQHTLGFRRNPFGALERDEWTAVAVLPLSLSDVLTDDGRHLQILGPMGSGKTTTMLKLVERFEQAGRRVIYEYLPEGERAYKTETAVLDIFCLDEVQRLTRWERRRLLSAAKAGLRLILSSHEDLTPLFQRWERPLLSVNLEETLTAHLYGRMLTRRLEYFALPNSAHTTLSTDAVEWVYEAFYPNMRDAEYFLYEVWQRETAVREVTAVHLKKLFAEIG
jgi:hypothetical protein